MFNNQCCPVMNEITTDMMKIVRMQKEAVRAELRDEFCSSNRLGCGRRDEFNTRPVQIFCGCNHPWSCAINRFNSNCEEEPKSCVFRIEKVERGCVTLRVLIDTGIHGPELNDVYDGCSKHKFLATDSFITIKLCDISAIRCLGDTFVDLCIRNIP